MFVKPHWNNTPIIKYLFELFAKNGFQLLVVGGAVRDSVLGKPTNDIDLTTDAKPKDVVSMAIHEGIPFRSQHERFGTIILGSEKVCVTSFRMDVNPGGRLTDIRLTDSIELDAKRRDFTINAIYADVHGEIIDPLDGLDDLRKGRVRFIGNPTERIQEDYLRVLRFFRFSAMYGNPQFGLDSKGINAILQIDEERLKILSKERITQEVFRLLATRPLYWCLKEMAKTPIWKRLFPKSKLSSFRKLEHFETKYALKPDRVLILSTLNVCHTNNPFALKRKEARQLAKIGELMECPMNLEEMAYRHGVALATSVHIGRFIQGKGIIHNDFLNQIEGIQSHQFPVKGSDLPKSIQGKQRGELLKQMEQAWILSGFRMSKKELLDKYL